MDSNKHLTAEAICINDSDIWFSSMTFNGLYRYCIKEKKTDFIGSFPKEKHNEWRLHGKALKVDEEIFFLPNRSRYIHVYDIKRQQIFTYDMKINGRINCKNAVLYKGSIYFVSENPEITLCQINIETKQIKKYVIDLNDYKGGICPDEVILNGKLYLACVCKNIVIEYNLDSKTYRLYKISKSFQGFGTIAYDGKFFWFSDSKNILKWNKGTESVESFEGFPKGFGMTVKERDNIIQHAGFSNKYNKDEKPFWCSVIMGQYLWLFPFRTNMIVKVNLLNMEMSEYPLLDEEEDKESLHMRTRITHCHYLGGMQGDKFLFLSTKTKRLYILKNTGNVNKNFYSFLTKEPTNFDLYFRSDIAIIGESENDKLDDFLKIIIWDNTLEENNYITNDIGSKIFDWVRSN